MHMSAHIPPTTADETERLADLVRRHHDSLDTMLLQPAGQFQTRTVALDTLTREVADCLAEGFRDRRPEDLPMLYCAWGKCRVGSTPLTNLFGVAGMPSYYQPLKASLRDALAGRPTTPWIVPSAMDQPHIFSKETAGPYVLAESLFIPLRPLIEAGYPPDRLHAIILDRDPASSLASWLGKWPDRAPESALLQNYVVAALNALRVESYAWRQGIPVTHFVYEASKEAVSSVRVLFDRLGLASRFTEEAVTDWRETGQLQSEGSRIIFPNEPAFYTAPGVHGSDIAYRYRARETAALSDAHLAMLERCGVNDVYRASVAACVRDLGLSASTSDRLFSRAVGVAA
jgi:hypothetical protein